MKLSIAAASLLLAVSFAPFAHANPVVVLTFEGIASPSNPTPPIGNYYNGGAGGNLGITFSPNALALCLNTSTQDCSNTSRGGLGDPNSQGGGLFFLSGSSTYMDDAAGFTSGFSLFYTAVNVPGSLEVYSGLDGTGTLLGTLNLPVTASGAPGVNCYGAGFCPFDPVGVSFSGTGQSIEFSGVANQIVFDDVTFGSATPGVTPEPSSLILLGTGLLGAAGMARRRFLHKA